MKVTAIAVLFSLVIASTASAMTYNNDLSLLIYTRTGESFLWNRSSQSLQFDAYNIRSEQGLLNPDTWVSISDVVASGPDGANSVYVGLGPDALSFGEANPSPAGLAELTLADGGTLQSGDKWPLGIISETPSVKDLDFTWSPNTPYLAHTSDVVLGGVVLVVPEPMSLGMLAIGALALLRRRRR